MYGPDIRLYTHDASGAASANHAAAARLLADHWAPGGMRAYVPWPVHWPTTADGVAAVDIHSTNRISIGDTWIVRNAAALGCSLGAGQVLGGVRIANPFADLS